MAEAVEKDPCPYPCICTESPKESLPRPTEESTKPDENNNALLSEMLGKDLSNVIEKLREIKLESISDVATLSAFENMTKNIQSMNKTLKSKNTEKKERRIEEISKKIKNEIRTRNTQSEYSLREKEFNPLPRCSTHPANDQRQENPTIKIEILLPLPGTHSQAINTVEHHRQNNEETRLKCSHCCGGGAKKKSVENSDPLSLNTRL